MPFVATVTVDAETEWVGSDVYTVVASDPEDDPLTMSLAGGGPFSITDGKNNKTSTHYYINVAGFNKMRCRKCDLRILTEPYRKQSLNLKHF